MRHGLKRPRLVLTPNGQSQFGSPCVGLFDQLFLAVVSGSLTRTTPCLRLRIATPVSHQVRLFLQRDDLDEGANCLMEECSRTDGSLPHADVPHDHAGTVTIDGIGPGSGGPAMPNTRVWAISPRHTFSRRWRVRSSRSG